MKVLKAFTIPFAHLKLGTHPYEFEVDNKFFEEFDCLDYTDSQFKVNVELTKQSTMLLLKFDFEGNITVPCDRCLDEVKLAVKGSEQLIVKFGSEVYEETDEILVIIEGEHELNVAKYIYEFIQLNVPQKRIHTEGECNPEVLEKLKSVEKEVVDPRWSNLNKLK